MAVRRSVSIAFLAFIALSLVVYAAGDTPNTNGYFSGDPTATPGTADERIAALEAQVADLQLRVRIAEGNIAASYGPEDALPPPLEVGTDVVFAEGYADGAYLPATGDAGKKLFTLVCGIAFPNENSAAQGSLMGYGVPAAWLTCGWVPYALH